MIDVCVSLICVTYASVHLACPNLTHVIIAIIGMQYILTATNIIILIHISICIAASISKFAFELNKYIDVH